MTALTPQQMRELADRIVAPWPADVLTKTERESAAALRGGADVIESVRAVLARAETENAPYLYPADIEAALTAGIAPQEGRDA